MTKRPAAAAIAIVRFMVCLVLIDGNDGTAHMA
jgi:hypothetical protein